jgi:Na+/melibiose symporter-like transporter
MTSTQRDGDKWFVRQRTPTRIRNVPISWKGWAAMLGLLVWAAIPPIVYAVSGAAAHWALWHLLVYLAFIAVTLFFWIRLVISKTLRLPDRSA